MDSAYKTHGFLYNGSTYTTLNAPGASGSGTKATSIYGTTVAGYYYGALGAVHGFLYNSTSSSYTTLDFYGATETYIYGIDGANVVGYYTKDGGNHGFLYDGLNWTTVDNPAGVVGSTAVTGISGGTLVGQYQEETPDGYQWAGFTTATAAVPEPSQWAMMGVTFVGVAGFVIRQRRAKAAAR